MCYWIAFTALTVSLMCLFQAECEAQCPEICYTTDLTGFGPGGTAGCVCTGSRPTRSGAGNCNCGQCYEETGGVIIGYAVNSDGSCTFGTNCGDCSMDTASTTPPATSTSTNAVTPPPTSTTEPPRSATATTDALATMYPVSPPDTLLSETTGTTTPNTVHNDSVTPSTPSGPSRSDDNNVNETAGSSIVVTSSENGLETWQIALIICCGVLVFTVAVVSVLSCYCKARNRLYENEDNQADASYYQQQPRQHGDVIGPDAMMLFPTSMPSHQRSGSSGSLANEMKPMYANPASNGSSDRLGTGLAPVHTRRSTSGDRMGVTRNSYSNAGNYADERVLSGSYPADCRPSSSNNLQGRQHNVEPRYSVARNRGSLAVEL